MAVQDHGQEAIQGPSDQDLEPVQDPLQNLGLDHGQESAPKVVQDLATVMNAVTDQNLNQSLGLSPVQDLATVMIAVTDQNLNQSLGRSPVQDLATVMITVTDQSLDQNLDPSPNQSLDRNLDPSRGPNPDQGLGLQWSKTKVMKMRQMTI